MLLLGGRMLPISDYYSDPEFSVAENNLSALCLDTPPDMGKEMCLTAATGTVFSGSESSQSVSVRVTQSGRQVQSSTKNPSRLIKFGKVLDVHNFNPFLLAQFLKSDGTQSIPRYIYSICCLRL